MSAIHIFNPSHDEALAANTPYYTAAKAAAVLEYDLAALPAWWACKGDITLVPKGHALDGKCINGCLLTSAPDWGKVDHVHPWGWDAAVCLRLTRLGIPQDLLPTDLQLEKIRNLSSRRTSVEILKNVVAETEQCIGESWWVTSSDEVKNLSAHFQSLVLKAPWSSSGRGVFKVSVDNIGVMLPRIERIIKRQGGIAVEPFYNRVMDFAFEFHVDKCGMTYNGISVFATSKTGAYIGNYVSNEERLKKRIPDELQERLPDVCRNLQRHLQRVYSQDYAGPLGVDMMVVESQGKKYIHPCVEINLRQTMGNVCVSLRSQLKSQHAVYKLRPVGEASEQELLLTPCAKRVEAVLLMGLSECSEYH